MITEYKDLLPFCGTVWCYDCFKAHVTEWEALSLYVCVTTILSLCPLLPDFFGVGITSETCDKEMWMCATDFQMSFELSSFNMEVFSNHCLWFWIYQPASKCPCKCYGTSKRWCKCRKEASNRIRVPQTDRKS